MVKHNKLDARTLDISFSSLSKIEIEILREIKKGLTSNEIAVLRGCSPRTIEKHRSNMIKKLDIPSSQSGLILWVHKHEDLFNK